MRPPLPFLSRRVCSPVTLVGLLWGALLAAVCVLPTGCGDDTCLRDFDCPEAQVCEPAGCAKACQTSADCPAPLTCHARRAEDGRACRLARPGE